MSWLVLLLVSAIRVCYSSKRLPLKIRVKYAQDSVLYKFRLNIWGCFWSKV
jgi:hypothetical protein